jgi:tricorn protease
MIVNEFAGSGGDAMPWYFHRAGVGKLIGERTWGGLVGLNGYPELMDGGVVMAPSVAVWNPNGTMDVENHGIAPDIEVPLDPAAVRQGHDPQLEKAIEVVMEELRNNPPPQLKRPPYPDYQKKLELCSRAARVASSSQRLLSACDAWPLVQVQVVCGAPPARPVLSTSPG